MKKISAIFLILAMVLSFASCDLLGEEEKIEVTIDPNAVEPQTMEELYSYYDKVKRGMTQDQVEEMFGKGEISYDDEGYPTYTTYTNEQKSAGVSVMYSDTGVVSAKVLYYANSAFLVKFCRPFTKDDLKNLAMDQLVRNAKEFIGEGIELSCEYSANNPADFSKIYSWFNPDGSNLQLYTDNDIIKQMVLNEKE